MAQQSSIDIGKDLHNDHNRVPAHKYEKIVMSPMIPPLVEIDVVDNSDSANNNFTACNRKRLVYWAEQLFAWLMLLLAIISGSAIGPVFKYMEHKHVPPCLSAAWRSMTMMIFLIPLAAAEIVYRRRKNKEPINWFVVNKESPTMNKYTPATHMLISGLAWTGNLLCWIEGLEYTTTVRASVFANVHPLMLVFVYQFFLRKGVSKWEWGGVAVVMGGIVLSAYRKALHKYDIEKHPHIHNSGEDDESDSGGNWMWFGDCLCLLAAASEMVVLLDRMKTKDHIPLMQVTCQPVLL
jgi:drug/metabolite transporter (DMT)-like permease